MAGCGGQSESRSRLAGAAARTVVSEFVATTASSPPATAGRRSTDRADHAKLALIENIQSRYGTEALPKAFVYCVAYSAGMEYPAAGLARLSLPPDPSLTVAEATAEYRLLGPARKVTDPSGVNGILGLSRGFRRVSKRLAIECLKRDAEAFRPTVTRVVVPRMDGLIVDELTGTRHYLPGYRACLVAAVPSLFAGAKLERLLVLTYSRPLAADEAEFAAGYRLGIGCVTSPRPAAAFRSLVASKVTSRLVQDGLPSRLIACVASTTRADLTVAQIRRLFALPSSELRRAADQITRVGNLGEIRRSVDQRLLQDIAGRALPFFEQLGPRLDQQCLGPRA